MNIYRMTDKQIRKALNQPFKFNCFKYASLGEIAWWEQIDKSHDSFLVTLAMFDICRSYHKLTGKQKVVLNAIEAGKLRFDYNVGPNETAPRIIKTRGNRHGNHR